MQGMRSDGTRQRRRWEDRHCDGGSGSRAWKALHSDRACLRPIQVTRFVAALEVGSQSEQHLFLGDPD